jgi:hypothetical protein
MGKPVTVPIPLIQDQLFISALLLNFPNNLAGGTHVKVESQKLKTLSVSRRLLSNSLLFYSPIHLCEIIIPCVFVLGFRP